MKLSDELYTQAKDIWESYYKHPFITEMGRGTLPMSKFRYFMIQDYLYLLQYAKVFAIGVIKAEDEKTMQKFSVMLYDILNGEMSIHKSYMERLNITKEEIENTNPSLANISYTSYMLWEAENGGILEIAAAVLACSWSYKLIGDKLVAIPNAIKHSAFGEWIKGYSSMDYAKSNQGILDMVDTLGEGCTPERRRKLTEIFVACSRYEYGFWDMAYGLQK